MTEEQLNHLIKEDDGDLFVYHNNVNVSLRTGTFPDHSPLTTEGRETATMLSQYYGNEMQWRREAVPPAERLRRHQAFSAAAPV